MFVKQVEKNDVFFAQTLGPEVKKYDIRDS